MSKGKNDIYHINNEKLSASLFLKNTNIDKDKQQWNQSKIIHQVINIILEMSIEVSWVEVLFLLFYFLCFSF